MTGADPNQIGLAFFTHPSSAGSLPVVEGMRIDHLGNVGIGTTTPNHALDIYSNENIPLRIHRPDNANLNSSGAWGIGFSTRGDATTSTTDTRAGIFSYYNGNMFLATGTSSIAADPDAYARLTILNTGNVGIGTVSPAYDLDVTGDTRITNDLILGNNQYSTFSANLHDDKWEQSPIAGTPILGNSQFKDGVGTYYTYDNAASGAVTNVRVADADAPNATGYVLRYTYTTGIGNPSPAYGGFYRGAFLGQYEKGDYLMHRILAKIPVGRNISWASNGFGTESAFKWLTTIAGTGDWKEYRAIQKVGETGAFSSTVFYYFSGGTDATFSVDIARHEVVAVNRSLPIFENYDKIYYGDVDTEIITEANIGTYTGLGALSNNRVPVYNSGTANLENSPIYSDGTNIAINTTGYHRTLNVSNAANNVVYSHFTHTGTGTGSTDGVLFGVNSGNNALIWNYENAGIEFATNAVTRMTIDNIGNVGIGTASPDAPLQVILQPNVTNNIFKSNVGDVLLGIQTFATTNRMQLMLGNYNGTGTPQLTTAADSNTGIQLTGGDILRIVNGGVETVTVNATGNVGIGTTTPSYNLHQYTTVGSIFHKIETTLGSDVGTIYSNDAQTWTVGIDASNTDAFTIASTEGVASNQKLTILPTGNVGIGTTTPFDKLHVAGGARVDGSINSGYGSAAEYIVQVGTGRTGNGYAYLDLIGDETYTDYGLRLIRNNTGANATSILAHRGTGALQLQTSDSAPITFFTNSAERMRISDTGDVSIGTSQARSKLSVVIDSDTVYNSNVAPFNGIDVLNAGDGNIASTFASLRLQTSNNSSSKNSVAAINVIQTTLLEHSTDLAFQLRDTEFVYNEVLRLSSSGRAGINTATPGFELDVVGRGRFTDSSNQLRLKATGVGTAATAYMYFYDGADLALGYVGYGSGVTHDLFLRNTQSAKLHLGTSSLDRMTIDASGNVGIGTTTPSYELHVAGSAKADAFVATDTNVKKITFPEGGSIWTVTAQTDKAIQIKLPVNDTTTRLSLKVVIYDPVVGLSELRINGFISGTTEIWSETSVYNISGNKDSDYTITFTEDGTDPYIYIGDLTSDWGIGTSVVITEVLVMGNIMGNTAAYEAGWEIIWEGTTINVPIAATLNNNLVAASGTYTPTITETSDSGGAISSASSTSSCKYTVTGNTVNFAVYFQVQSTSTSTNAEYRVSLPIASNFNGTYDVIATSNVVDDGGSGVLDVDLITADTTNDAIKVGFQTSGRSGTSALKFMITGQYTIK
jgi:hypothetical protein